MKFLFLTACVILAGCAKNSEIAANDIQPQAQQTPSRKPAASAADLPVVTFDQSQITVNRNDKIHLHVLLDRKLSEPVSVNVALADSTAVYQRDYAGFASGNRQIQPTVFEPGTIVAHFPRILVTGKATCGGKFLVKLTADQGQKIVLGPPVEVLVNCP